MSIGERSETKTAILLSMEDHHRNLCDIAGVPNIVFLHDPEGLTQEDFLHFCDPDDAASKKIVSRLRGNLAAYARDNNGFSDKRVDGQRVFITRATVEKYALEIEEGSGKLIGLLRFILDHTEPAEPAEPYQQYQQSADY